MNYSSNPVVIHFKLIHQIMLSWICIKLTIQEYCPPRKTNDSTLKT